MMINSFPQLIIFRGETIPNWKSRSAAGVSIQTLRNWIYSGKVQTLRTAGGEHQIPEFEIRRILGLPAPTRQTVGFR